MGKINQAGYDLYTGERSIDFVGRRWLWYAISLIVVALALGALAVKPLNFGVQFTGGSMISVTVGPQHANQAGADSLRNVVSDSGVEGAENPIVVTEGANRLNMRVQALTGDQEAAIEEVILAEFPHLDRGRDISTERVGPSWGRDVAERALIGVAIFLALVVLFIWLYFREWKMSVAALAALFHDIVITVGIYALSGFQVTPAAVTGLLAILAFSLYDTVVVFDKVRENTTTLRKNTQSYADAANLAVNQTLVRSINTSIVALLPIGAILYFTVTLLGSSSLQDLALVQFVGMAAGVYSSIIVAPRVLVHMKSGEAEIKDIERRARAKAKGIAADRYHSVPNFAEDMDWSFQQLLGLR
jgi:preprotein translocase subunit SecF